MTAIQADAARFSFRPDRALLERHEPGRPLRPVIERGASQDGISKVGIRQQGPRKISSTKIGAGQIDAPEVSLPQIHLAKVGAAQIRRAQLIGRYLAQPLSRSMKQNLARYP